MVWFIFDYFYIMSHKICFIDFHDCCSDLGSIFRFPECMLCLLCMCFFILFYSVYEICVFCFFFYFYYNFIILFLFLLVYYLICLIFVVMNIFLDVQYFCGIWVFGLYCCYWLPTVEKCSMCFFIWYLSFVVIISIYVVLISIRLMIFQLS